MLKASLSDGTLKGFLNLLIPQPFEESGIAFYRPLFREALHNIYYSIFGLNHYPFRVLMFLIHLTNITLVYILIRKIFSQNALAILTAFFFGITAANVSTLNYLAGGIEAGGATAFALTALIIYKRYLENGKKIFYVLSFFTFILAIFSHEIVASLAVILLIMLFLSPVKKISLKIPGLIPFFLMTAVLLFIDLVIIGLSPGEKQYQAVFNPKTIINSFAWYWGWALGLPETLIDFVGPGLKLNPTLMRYWGNFYQFIFPAFAVSMVGLSASFIYLAVKSKEVFKDKKFLFFLLWFPIGITPVIFLPAHKSTHYLIFVLPAFWLVISYIILKSKYTLIPLITLISLIILSVSSIKLGDTTYWAASRGKMAQQLLSEVKNTYPALPKGAVVYFTNDKTYPFLTKEWGGTSKQASLILNGSDALQLLYNDPTLTVFYEDSDKPQNLAKKIYTLEAKLK